ncbi:hypothetical protein BIW11_06396 [Tropilaelaps mercedesae]|uniref:Uncharacterized protein n=1 Tax=Tropilaelaps mercedesae TaxID=418985 RepID=A0A1V9XY60_9ACAR|nr:hypothetical protein BIW11_06396 [Tropilaelaps mercedesae]
MRLKARGIACSAPQLWRALVVILVLVISVLQVVHITLLSRLEARRSRDDRRTARSPLTDWGGDKYGVAEMSDDRARMHRLLEESAVLDISGEFSLVSNFQPASPPLRQTSLHTQGSATPAKQQQQQVLLTTQGATLGALSSTSSEHSRS